MGMGNTKNGKSWNAIDECVNFKEQHRCKEQMYGYKPGHGVWNELGDWDWHIYIYISIYISHIYTHINICAHN